MLGKIDFIKLVEENITPSEFKKIKLAFINEINSKRRFEQISDITTLLNVLEDRLTLNGDNMEALNVIVNNIEKLKGKTVTLDNYFESEEKGNLTTSVLEVINTKYQGDWKELGKQLGLDEEEIQQKCENIQDVIICYSSKCNKISNQELCFRITRALETCNETTFVNYIKELI